MFVEVFVKGVFWFLVCIVGVIFALFYFFLLPAMIAEFILKSATILDYCVAFLFSIVLHFFFYIRFVDYKDKKEHEDRLANTEKLLRERWGKDV